MAPVEPKGVADIDLAALRRQMADTMERAKANDPRELRRQLTALKAELAGLERLRETPDSAAAIEAACQAVRIEMNDGWGRVLKHWTEHLEGIVGEINGMAERMKATREHIGVLLGYKLLDDLRIEPPQRPPAPSGRSSQPRRPRTDSAANGAGALTGPEQRILDAIAWMESIGIAQPEQTAVAFLAGYRVNGGAYNNPRGALRSRGLVDYFGGRIGLTPEGRRHACPPTAPLTTSELQAAVMARLPGPEQRILSALIETYPRPMSNEDCARAANYTPDGGAYNNPRGRLRSLGLISYPAPGQVCANDLLFLK